MTPLEEKQAALTESVKLLVSHPPFKEFVKGIKELRESAISYAASREAMVTAQESYRALGEVAAYCDILAIISEHVQAPDANSDLTSGI